jgi:hypothetical protein
MLYTPHTITHSTHSSYHAQRRGDAHCVHVAQRLTQTLNWWYQLYLHVPVDIVNAATPHAHYTPRTHQSKSICRSPCARSTESGWKAREAKLPSPCVRVCACVSTQNARARAHAHTHNMHAHLADDVGNVHASVDWLARRLHLQRHLRARTAA